MIPTFRWLCIHLKKRPGNITVHFWQEVPSKWSTVTWAETGTCRFDADAAFAHRCRVRTKRRYMFFPICAPFRHTRSQQGLDARGKAILRSQVLVMSGICSAEGHSREKLSDGTDLKSPPCTNTDADCRQFCPQFYPKSHRFISIRQHIRLLCGSFDIVLNHVLPFCPYWKRQFPVFLTATSSSSSPFFFLMATKHTTQWFCHTHLI